MDRVYAYNLDLFYAYPLVVLSALASYVLLAIFCWPQSGKRYRDLIAHPVTPNQHYLYGFDSMRGIAALLVAAGHLWFFTYYATFPAQLAVPQLGFAAKAVPMFVMLSGFLIYRSVLNIKSLAELRIYFWRRFFRIYPAYLVSVILIVCIGQMQTTQGNYGSFSFFLAELFALRAFDAPYYSNPVTWSLYVEIAFYIALPPFVAMVGRRAMIPACIIGALVFIISDPGISREFALWKYFFFGILASEIALLDRERALEENGRPLLSRPTLVVILVVGLIWLAADIAGPEYDLLVKLGLVRPDPSNYTVGLAISYSMVLLALARMPDIAKFLDIYPLRYLGVISYSVFLIHPFYMVLAFPGLQLMNFHLQTDLWKDWPTMPTTFFFLVYIPGLFIWATLVFLLVEKPALQFGKRWINANREKWGTEPIGGLTPPPISQFAPVTEPEVNSTPKSDTEASAKKS